LSPLSGRSQRRQTETAGASTIVSIQLQVTQKRQDEWCVQSVYDKTGRGDLEVAIPTLQQQSDGLGSSEWYARQPAAGRVIICVE